MAGSYSTERQTVEKDNTNKKERY